jgi:hypothetical protein
MLNTLSLSENLSWSQSHANNGTFQPTTQGLDSVQFTLQGINVTTFNEIDCQYLTITAGSNTTIDLTAMQDLVYQNFSFGHVLGIAVKPVGGNITLSAGASNGQKWFLNSGGNITINGGGSMFWFDSPSNSGTVINAGNKTLKFANNDAVTSNCTISIVGSTS